MKYIIECSLGELIDKITILSIKLEKTDNNFKKKNIRYELDLLLKHNIDFVSVNYLDELKSINMTLWELEDLIRIKSKKQQFDDTYLLCSEKIHKFNDTRYKIKNQINNEYNSEIIEEKIYSTETDSHKEKLELGKLNYSRGNYKKSLEIISELASEVVSGKIDYNSFTVDVLFSYEIITSIFNIKNNYYDKLEYIIKNIEDLDLSPEQSYYCRSMVCTSYLKKKKYTNAFPYLNQINHIKGPGINFSNMSFFKINDTGKTLLIYEGGGLGDYFMFSRMIPILCRKYSKNNILFLVNDVIEWIFKDIFKNIQNLFIVPYKLKTSLPRWDYHCSLLSLLRYLDITYESIEFEPLFNNLSPLSKVNNKIIESIKTGPKKTYVFNWFGNSENKHEKNNRRMELKYALPLFRISHINWIVVSKNITEDEKSFLKKHNVNYVGDSLDNGPDAFYDTIGIIKHADGVVTTDTSIAHLSCNLDKKTYIMLTTGCEWRWTQDPYTRWYPNAHLIRQNNQGNWEEVVQLLTNLL